MRKTPLVTLKFQILLPSGRGSIIMLEYADAATASRAQVRIRDGTFGHD
ncbi:MULTISPECIES: hypothetical protein [Bradyrhizobium]|nr:hypothetical protein [Bradyrhizobium elkanii]MBP2433929.1 hypothetical protein [Bradyrhizobium elkanii]MBR1159982.1 hypothetical protein [Bradyrhizobium elkanii]WLA85705.1 hypothetical protein QNJ99_16630 [Bradyrhizobium elkanii]WLA89100.1 hypothetical protein QNJ96_29040 [Bradyrhizobium elkanii]